MNFKQKIIEEIEDYLKEDKISKVKMVYAWFLSSKIIWKIN